MKSLVVYYSKTGVTKRAAVAISRMLGSDIEEIVDLKDRGGIIGRLYGGRDALLKKPTDIKRPKKDPSKYKLVVIGTPVWAHSLTPAVRTYLNQKKRKLRKVAFFSTKGGLPRTIEFASMQELCGKKPVGTLSLKIQDMISGEYFDKARKFVSKIKKGVK